MRKASNSAIVIVVGGAILLIVFAAFAFLASAPSSYQSPATTTSTSFSTYQSTSQTQSSQTFQQITTTTSSTLSSLSSPQTSSTYQQTIQTTQTTTSTPSGRIWHVPDDYSSIDQAIIAASPGDTIKVGSGTFPGFKVDKAVTLVGTGPNSTKITDLVSVSANHATIEGMYFTAGIKITGGSDNRILDNTITAGSIPYLGDSRLAGILIDQSTYAEVSNNIIAAKYSIELNYANNARISNNTISGTFGVISPGGGEFDNTAPGNNLIISHNKFVSDEAVSLRYGCDEPPYTTCWRFHPTPLTNNIVTDNTINAGVGIYFTGTGTVSGNRITGDSTYSIGIKIASKGAKVTDNTVAADTGIMVASSDVVGDNANIELSGNNIQAISTGLSVPPASSTTTVTSNSKISGNQVQAKLGLVWGGRNSEISGNSFHNCETGMEIIGGGNQISGNTLENCNLGLAIDSQSRQNLIFKNNFINNQKQAQDDGQSNTWYSNGTGNYWSDSTSPDSNGDGIVDNPYVIPGSARSVDRYPLVSPTAVLVATK